MYARVEAYDILGTLRIHAVLLDHEDPDTPWDVLLDRVMECHWHGAAQSPADLLAEIAENLNELAYKSPE